MAVATLIEQTRYARLTARPALERALKSEIKSGREEKRWVRVREMFALLVTVDLQISKFFSTIMLK